MRFLYTLLFAACVVQAQTAPAKPLEPGQPITTEQKFQLRVVDGFSIRGLAGQALGAAIGQGLNTPSEWGQGASGYGLRYVSGLGATLSRQSMAFGIEALDHEDPRYFPSKERGFKARLGSVLRQSFWSYRDDGSQGFAYGRVISAFASGQLVNAWQPPSNNSYVDGLERGCITLGVDAGLHLAQELFPKLRPKQR